MPWERRTRWPDRGEETGSVHLPTVLATHRAACCGSRGVNQRRPYSYRRRASDCRAGIEVALPLCPLRLDCAASTTTRSWRYLWENSTAKWRLSRARRAVRAKRKLDFSRARGRASLSATSATTTANGSPPASSTWAAKRSMATSTYARDPKWRALVERTHDEFGRLDILINNAGILRTGILEDLDPADYMEVIQVNQVGVLLGMQAVIPALKEAGGGIIVNTSSTAGLTGIAGGTAYVASKWAVRGMTKVAALELGKYGIRVNSVHPGPIDTPMIAGLGGSSVTQPIARSGHPGRGRQADALPGLRRQLLLHGQRICDRRWPPGGPLHRGPRELTWLRRAIRKLTKPGMHAEAAVVLAPALGREAAPLYDVRGTQCVSNFRPDASRLAGGGSAGRMASDERPPSPIGRPSHLTVARSCWRSTPT